MEVDWLFVDSVMGRGEAATDSDPRELIPDELEESVVVEPELPFRRQTVWPWLSADMGTGLSSAVGWGTEVSAVVFVMV